jgi:hypothetical protein
VDRGPDGDSAAARIDDAVRRAARNGDEDSADAGNGDGVISRDATETLSRDRAADLARSLADLVGAARTVLLGGPDGSAAVRAIGRHLGVPYDEAILVSAELPAWQHVSAHRAAEAHREQARPDADWFGLSASVGMHRQHMELMGLLGQDAGRGQDRPNRADYITAATGPHSTEEVVAFGLLCTAAPSGAPAVLALRTAQMHGPPAVMFEVLSAERADAAALLARLNELTEEHDVVRGQVVTFGVNEHMGNELVSFLPRPALAAEDVILPSGVLDTIERHVVGPAGQAERLREMGIHLKRGLLLHGPPGTGKTHTVRYLMGRLHSATVVVLSGTSLRFIEQAAAMARRLAPTVVVIEDVDLVATDRSFSPTGNPLLFSLLDAMDGVAADADVTFVLTTNRAADLEAALTQRPGRVDLAVEIPRPDAAARRRLFQLYRGRAAVTGDLDRAVAVTEGATASAIKELMRRAVLAALRDGPDGETVLVDDAVLDAVLADYASERESLSRSLLGAGDDGESADASGPVVQPGLAPAAHRGWTSYRPGR